MPFQYGVLKSAPPFSDCTALEVASFWPLLLGKLVDVLRSESLGSRLLQCNWQFEVNLDRAMK